MFGPLTDINKAGITTLYQFAQQAKMDSQNGEDPVLCLRDEALAVKHTLTTFHTMVDKSIKEYNQIVAMAARVENTNYPDEDQKKVDQQKLDASEKAKLQSLLLIQQQMREAVVEVAKIVKAAAEVESIKATRFDSLQLLQLLQQIPLLVTDILTKHLTKTMEEVVDEICHTETAVKEFPETEFSWPDHQIVNNVFEIREHAINELVLAITSEMSEQINQLKVAYNKDTFGGGTGGETGQSLAVDPAEVIRRQVVDMMSAVPTAPPVEDN